MKQLREESMKYGQTLTQKLATSQSGQNLLHIGTSLSTLPPDLQQLVSCLHPLVVTCETVESKQIQQLEYYTNKVYEIQSIQQRVVYTNQLIESFQDLQAAESIVKKQLGKLQQQKKNSSSGNNMITSKTNNNVRTPPSSIGFGNRPKQQQLQNQQNGDEDGLDEDFFVDNDVEREYGTSFSILFDRCICFVFFLSMFFLHSSYSFLFCLLPYLFPNVSCCTFFQT